MTKGAVGNGIEAYCKKGSLVARGIERDMFLKETGKGRAGGCGRLQENKREEASFNCYFFLGTFSVPHKLFQFGGESLYQHQFLDDYNSVSGHPHV